MSGILELELRGPVAFTGPLDLLLAIVRRNEYPLDQLPLGEITRQFSAYLEQHRAQLEQADLELGAEFFETASWLTLLKSRTLLPQSEESREAEPAEELRQALISYDQARRLGDLMGERLEAVGMASSRRPEAGEQGTAADTDTELSEKVPTVQDAVVAARRALAAARAHAEARVSVHAGIAVAEVLAALDARLARLALGSILSTGTWFAEANAETASVLLLALLELARLGTLWVHQPAPYAAVWIQRPPVEAKEEPSGRPGWKPTDEGVKDGIVRLTWVREAFHDRGLNRVMSEAVYSLQSVRDKERTWLGMAEEGYCRFVASWKTSPAKPTEKKRKAPQSQA